MIVVDEDFSGVDTDGHMQLVHRLRCPVVGQELFLDGNTGFYGRHGFFKGRHDTISHDIEDISLVLFNQGQDNIIVLLHPCPPGDVTPCVHVFRVTADIGKHGLIGFAGKFRPSGIPWWLSVLIVPIEIITWLIRPFSLAIRLCANMVAGHTVIVVFIGMTMSAAILVKPVPFVGAVAMSAFELFVCFVQAFIFTMLTGLYMREALDDAH